MSRFSCRTSLYWGAFFYAAAGIRCFAGRPTPGVRIQGKEETQSFLSFEEFPSIISNDIFSPREKEVLERNVSKKHSKELTFQIGSFSEDTYIATT